MTTENRHHEVQPPSDDGGRYLAVSSADLWRGTTGPLGGDKESRAKRCEAVEVPELVIHGALDSEAPSPKPEDGAPRDPDPPPPGGSSPLGFKDPAGPAENLNTSVEASAQPAGSGAGEVPERAVDTGVPEPVFYVPPYVGDVLPATSVVELTASALDAVLASEFGSTDSGPSGIAPRDEARPTYTTETSRDNAPAPPRQIHEPAFERVSADTVGSAPMSVPTAVPAPVPVPVPTTEHSKVLDILLGTPRTTENAQSHTEARAASGATSSNAAASAPVAPIPVPESVIVMASPPPPPPVFTEDSPPPPPPVFTDDASPASSVFTAEPDAYTAKPDVPSSPVFEAELVPPLPAPVFVTEELPQAAPPPPPPPPPKPATPPPPPAPTLAGPVGFPFTEAPTPVLQAPSSPPGASTYDAPAGSINGIETQAARADDEDDVVFPTDESAVTSNASMATEILSASPDVAAVALPEEPRSEFISKDVTLIARGRRKRFRLH